MMAELDSFQQTKRRAMATSYAHLLLVLVPQYFEMHQLPWLSKMEEGQERL